MKKQLKIAFFARLTDKKLNQILLPLQKSGMIEEIYLFRKHRFEGEKIIWVGVPAFISNFKYAYEVIRIFQAIYYSSKFDLIVGCQQRLHGVSAFILGILLKKPVIQLIVSQVELIMSRWIERKAVLSAAACGVMGPSSERILKDSFSGKIEVIRLPFEMPLYKKNDGAQSYDIIAVADFAWAKDYPWMINVLKKLKSKIGNFKIGIVGKNIKENTYSQIISNGIEDNVHFLGSLHGEDLDNAYRQAKIFLLTSQSEGLPMVVVEAMSHSLPVIATDVGDISWLVRNGIDGFVIQHGDTEGMADAIACLLPDSRKMSSFAASSRRRIEELYHLFEISEITKSWDNLIRAVHESKA